MTLWPLWQYDPIFKSNLMCNDWSGKEECRTFPSHGFCNLDISLPAHNNLYWNKSVKKSLNFLLWKMFSGFEFQFSYLQSAQYANISTKANLDEILNLGYQLRGLLRKPNPKGIKIKISVNKTFIIIDRNQVIFVKNKLFCSFSFLHSCCCWPNTLYIWHLSLNGIKQFYKPCACFLKNYFKILISRWAIEGHHGPLV